MVVRCLLWHLVFVTSWCCSVTDGRIELVFRVEVSFHLSYSFFLRGNSGISKNTGPFVRNFSETVDIFATARRSPQRVVNLGGRQ